MSDSDGLDSDDNQGRDRRMRAIRGGTPRIEAAPKFSQPVRQIVLLLMVLALVGIGAWFAYVPIMSIFMANKALNGAILFVFVLGVLTCFWQVAQLVKSVSWIERFAARRRNAAESGIATQTHQDNAEAPRLLAPLAALLGARGPSGGAISTESSRSILESVATRIDEERDITRYLSNLLIFLGLLGTFYGLATTVPAVVDTIRALQPQDGESGMQVFDKLMSGLEGQLGGMGTAFSSSLLGLAGSLVVGLLELFVGHGQNRFFRELEEWMSGFTRVDLAGGGTLDQATAAGFLEQVSGQMADLHEYYLRRDEDRDREASAAETRILAMTQGMEKLTAELLRQGSTVIGQAETTQAAMMRLADAQDAVVSRLAAPREDGAVTALLSELVEGQKRSAPEADAVSNRSIADALVRVAENQERILAQFSASGEAQAARTTMTSEMLHRLAQGQDRLIQLAENTPAQDGGNQDLLEARMHLRSIDQHLSRLVEEMASGRADLLGELRDDMSALTIAIRRLGQLDEA